jgi:hypothetical protein
VLAVLAVQTQAYPVTPYTTACTLTQPLLPYYVLEYPSSAHRVVPFVDQFRNPASAQASGVACRGVGSSSGTSGSSSGTSGSSGSSSGSSGSSGGHCVVAYFMDVVDKALRVFDNAVPYCKSLPEGTWFLTYNGTAPGPTITSPRGHETLVRFNNKVTNNSFFKDATAAADAAASTPNRPRKNLCSGNRTGHPIAVHVHGAASLAVFDGWAEDEICRGESKDYVYPNNMAATLW